MVLLLLLFPILTFSQNESTQELLSQISSIRYKNSVQLIEKGADPNYINPSNKESLLMMSLKEGNIDLAKALISLNTNLNYLDPTKNTALSIATKYGHREIIPSLIEHGASPSKSTPNAILLAAEYGHDKILSYFLKENLSLNVRDEAGNTPLMLVAQNNHPKLIKLILSKDENSLNLTNKEGNTALGEALRRNYIKPIKELFKYGASLSFTNKQEQTPLLLALENGGLESIKLILTQDPKFLDFVDKQGNTVLIIGAYLNEVKSTALLLSYKQIPINAQNHDGDTALHIASRYEFEEMAQLLIKNGADPTILNKKKESPLSIVQKERNESLIKLFEQASKKNK